MKSPLAAAACIVLSVSTGLLGQMQNNTEKQMTCDNRGYDSDRARHCDIREQTMAAVGRLGLEAHNGSVTIKGWLQSGVLVRARVESAAETQSAADLLANQVSISTGGGDVHAIGPNTVDNTWWSASYEIFLPQTTDLSLKTHNGAVAISDVRGQIRFEAHNGAVHLKRLAGDVSGGTHNGEIKAELMGSLWEGRQLELSTNNGGITLSMPAGYSAHVQAETSNGHIQSDFPITVSGEIKPRRLDTNIGSGGSPIHLTTHNGQVTLQRAGLQ